MAHRAFWGITVTLADTNPHSLLALLGAIDADILTDILQNVQSLRIQADDSNGANFVYIGDDQVSSTRKAYSLLLRDQVPYQSPAAIQVPLKDVYVRASAATCMLNVEIIL